MSEHLTLQTPSERGWAARPGTECGHSEQPLISAREGNINNSFYFPTNFTSPCLLFFPVQSNVQFNSQFQEWKRELWPHGPPTYPIERVHGLR